MFPKTTQNHNHSLVAFEAHMRLNCVWLNLGVEYLRVSVKTCGSLNSTLTLMSHLAYHRWPSGFCSLSDIMAIIHPFNITEKASYFSWFPRVIIWPLTGPPRKLAKTEAKNSKIWKIARIETNISDGLLKTALNWSSKCRRREILKEEVTHKLMKPQLIQIHYKTDWNPEIFLNKVIILERCPSITRQDCRHTTSLGRVKKISPLVNIGIKINALQALPVATSI